MGNILLLGFLIICCLYFIPIFLGLIMGNDDYFKKSILADLEYTCNPGLNKVGNGSVWLFKKYFRGGLKFGIFFNTFVMNTVAFLFYNTNNDSCKD